MPNETEVTAANPAAVQVEQPAAAATEIQPAESGAATPAAGTPPPQQGFGMMVPMLLILALFYFMFIRPQNRKEKERQKMIEELRAGAKIVFAGGIVGTIVEATEKTFKGETAPGTQMEILRNCVQGVVASEAEAAK